ncbi:MAG: cytochrome c biogenesis protein CcsA [Dehalococcoidia bacterium]|jgi:cytochrome c-type biogenesis protein CcsB
MLQLEILSFVIALVTLQIVLILYIWGFISSAIYNKSAEVPDRLHAGKFARYTFPLLIVSWLALTASLIIRSTLTLHVPFTDMYEFASSFCWGVMFAGILFQWRLKSEVFGAGGSIIALALLLYAFFLPAEHMPLPAALRQTWLLPLHVSCAIMAYGMFALGFASAVLYLLRQKYPLSIFPSSDTLDRAGHLAVLTGFPLMTLVIIIGAIWAKVAWGNYWTWDPKETASLVTWIIYAVYLVTRLFFGWRNDKSAWLLILGFLAVLVTFFGNLFFGGLHSYVS